MEGLVIELSSAQLDALADRIAARIGARPGDAPAEEDRWLTSAEAARYLGLPSVNALHRLCAEGKVPSAQAVPRGRHYFQRSQLDAWRGV